MSLRSLLLRVLLSLALVLNGTTSAMAAAQMTFGHQASGHQASQTTPQDVPAASHEGMADCHQGNGPQTAPASHDPASRDSSPAPHTPSPDCCEGGGCLCACTHGMQATASSPALVARDYGQAGATGMPATAHASPRLPNLIRPPIG